MSSVMLNSSIDLTIPEWLQKCLTESPADDRRQSEIALIRHAFEFAYQLHQGQYRKSGEAYICHPMAVAGLLRDFGGSAAMIAAGFLHDVVEDTDVTCDEIEYHFGAEVRRLVEGVTKLSKLDFKSKTENQAENFRRMFLAMAQDIRVIVVKLADRLHNMRTLQHLREEKRRRIALETREIFAPLANRLGMWRVKSELEDLAFKYLEPDAYEQVLQYVAQKQANRQQRLSKSTEIVLTRLQQAGIQCLEVSGRSKHLYSIYQKMLLPHKEFHEIYDLAGLRIIVRTHEECYRALAVVHDIFRPIPGHFRDYIGLPKPNGYQSLHTAVVSSTGKLLEVQIRTLEMDYLADYGITAFWRLVHSLDTNRLHQQKLNEFAWLNELVACNEEIRDASEYMQSIKNDLTMEEVYVFTPKGDLISLPTKSTPVDFAYKIHTNLGNRLAKVKINGEDANEITMLTTGDTVEIQTDSNAEPKLGWVKAVATNKAKNAIRRWHKNKYASESKSKLLNSYIVPVVNLSFVCVDRIGILKDVIEKFYRYQINVQGVHVETNTNGIAKINLCIETNDAEKLNECVKEISRISDILDFRVVEL
ncbi:MAG: bifunctional (p)ppGpp synthetase/guanosine-3',5'-bis(diphosphate) 3'-pyrophosphohydrolase [Stigonema ocellatum SAG 48.90 = DSM 106950]|nr:bifunctional (p)ppGpp synthetase/guanosine-3',5'-bis(diphosphate) 3'-pyrophosphohydrolase [Stigonema ocellatum SAG 48.90 = DSM 106950]